MGRTLKEQISKRTGFASAREEAMLNVYRTASHLSGPEQAFFRQYRLSPASYNLLRILRGHHRSGDAQGIRASEIGCQMVVRMPDVTRLVDRLESMKLVTRRAASDDKRVKYVQITKKGLALLDEIDPKLDGLIENQLGHMNEQDLRALSRLLELARREEHAEDQADDSKEHSV
jgi:DNA-binding MarR family transcriptional regulator